MIPGWKFLTYTYYSRYNHRWTRSVQNAVGTVLITAWLGGLGSDSRPGEIGRLLTIEEVGELLQGKSHTRHFYASSSYFLTCYQTITNTAAVPVNVKDRDVFHITIEEYLLAMTDITEELSRLSMNSVTMGDIDLTVRISGFIKDLFAGFQLLNLKNDTLRRRVDAVKYHVKKVEDVIYDLSLRNLLPQSAEEQS